MSGAVLAAQDAFAAGDDAVFAAAMRDVGVELDLPAFRAFCDAHGEWWKLLGGRLLEVIYGALHGELGYAMAAAYTRTMLVARTADHVVIGAQPTTTVKQPFPDGGWPIKRWSKTDPAKNAALVEAWVAGVVNHPYVMIVRRVAAPLGAAARDDGAAVFAALVEDPTDAGARAVYADWLIERGDPRGEIMRLQAEGRREEASRRTRAATAVIREHVPSCVRRVEDHCGIVEGIVLTPADLARHGAAMFARYPIHVVSLIATDAAQVRELSAAADVPLGRIRQLHLEARTARGVRGLCPIEPSALLATEVFANLRALRLRGLGDDLAEWQRFLGGMGAPHLERLHVDEVASAAIVHALVAPATLPHLRALMLWQRLDGDALPVAHTIASRPALAKLAINRWHRDADVMTEVATALVAAPALVDISIPASSDRLVRALAGGRFERVALSGMIDAGALTELVERLPLRALEVWCDGGSNVDEVVGVIERAPARLAHVHWQHPDLTNDQAARIAATRTLEEHVIRG